MERKMLAWMAVLLAALMLAACQPNLQAAPAETALPGEVEGDLDASNQGQDPANQAEAEASEAEAETDAGQESDPASTAIDPAGLFIANGCAGCHGSERQGGGAPALLPERLTRPAVEYVSILTNGKGRMPAFGSDLSAGEIEALVAWLLTPLE